MKEFVFLEMPNCYPTAGEVIDTPSPEQLEGDRYLAYRIVGGTDLEQIAIVRTMRYEMYMMDQERLEYIIDNFPFQNANTVRKMYNLVQLDKARQEERFRELIKEFMEE